MSEQGYCYLCKNRCPLSSPKCKQFLSPQYDKLQREKAEKAANTCRMCDKACPVDDPGCSLGKTIQEIKGRQNKNKNGETL